MKNWTCCWKDVMRLPQLTDKITISDNLSLEGRNSSTSWGSPLAQTLFRLVVQSYYPTGEKEDCVTPKQPLRTRLQSFRKKMTFELRIKDLETKSSQFSRSQFCSFQGKFAHCSSYQAVRCSSPGTHFSKAPETFRARKAIFRPSEKCMHLKLLVKLLLLIQLIEEEKLLHPADV